MKTLKLILYTDGFYRDGQKYDSVNYFCKEFIKYIIGYNPPAVIATASNVRIHRKGCHKVTITDRRYASLDGKSLDMVNIGFWMDADQKENLRNLELNDTFYFHIQPVITVKYDTDVNLKWIKIT